MKSHDEHEEHRRWMEAGRKLREIDPARFDELLSRAKTAADSALAREGCGSNRIRPGTRVRTLSGEVGTVTYHRPGSAYCGVALDGEKTIIDEQRCDEWLARSLTIIDGGAS